LTVRTILHVDMDAFYASVEERDRPALKGKPLIVGGRSGRGVVAAANYAVRRYGVRSAMPMREALRRCPHAVCVRPRMTRYREISEQVFAIFRAFTPLVEGLSLDEAFLDVTACRRLLGDPGAIGGAIRRRIRTATDLPASVGIGPNKLLAKIASDLGKPDGLFRIGDDNLRGVLDPLPIERLPGVGPKSLARVHAAGVMTVGDARRASDEVLWRAFGRYGSGVRALASGIDERPVVAEREEQSISAEETFGTDITSTAQLEWHLGVLADRAAARLRAHELAAGRVTLKIRRADFKTYTRQRVLEPPTQNTGAVTAMAQRLLREWRAAHPDAALRLLGVGVTDLRTPGQADLFYGSGPRDSRLDAAIDGIRDRFGSGLLTRASLLPRRRTGSASRGG
jgi:DNA polymerase IV